LQNNSVDRGVLVGDRLWRHHFGLWFLRGLSRGRNTKESTSSIERSLKAKVKVRTMSQTSTLTIGTVRGNVAEGNITKNARNCDITFDTIGHLNNT